MKDKMRISICRDVDLVAAGKKKVSKPLVYLNEVFHSSQLESVNE